jgi:hypothetical protein
MIRKHLVSRVVGPIGKSTPATLLALACTLAAILILPVLASQDPVKDDAWRPPHETQPSNLVFTDLWLPADVDDLADHLRRNPKCQTFEEFQRYLNDQGRKHLWYAAVVRWCYSDGRFEEATYVRHPFDWPENFDEFRSLIMSGEVESSYGLPPGQSPRSVHLVGADQEGRPPTEVIADTPGVGGGPG